MKMKKLIFNLFLFSLFSINIYATDIENNQVNVNYLTNNWKTLSDEDLNEVLSEMGPSKVGNFLLTLSEDEKAEIMQRDTILNQPTYVVQQANLISDQESVLASNSFASYSVLSTLSTASTKSIKGDFSNGYVADFYYKGNATGYFKMKINKEDMVYDAKGNGTSITSELVEYTFGATNVTPYFYELDGDQSLTEKDLVDPTNKKENMQAATKNGTTGYWYTIKATDKSNENIFKVKGMVMEYTSWTPYLAVVGEYTRPAHYVPYFESDDKEEYGSFDFSGPYGNLNTLDKTHYGEETTDQIRIQCHARRAGMTSSYPNMHSVGVLTLKKCTNSLWIDTDGAEYNDPIYGKIIGKQMIAQKVCEETTDFVVPTATLYKTGYTFKNWSLETVGNASTLFKNDVFYHENRDPEHQGNGHFSLQYVNAYKYEDAESIWKANFEINQYEFTVKHYVGDSDGNYTLLKEETHEADYNSRLTTSDYLLSYDEARELEVKVPDASYFVVTEIPENNIVNIYYPYQKGLSVTVDTSLNKYTNDYGSWNRGGVNLDWNDMVTSENKFKAYYLNKALTTKTTNTSLSNPDTSTDFSGIGDEAKPNKIDENTIEIGTDDMEATVSWDPVEDNGTSYDGFYVDVYKTKTGSNLSADLKYTYGSAYNLAAGKSGILKNGLYNGEGVDAIYNITAAGGKGANIETSSGGSGASITIKNVSVSESDKLYGVAGSSGNNSVGGYNGGGNGGAGGGSAGGGGASHVATYPGNGNNLLSSYEKRTEYILVAAGGGGGGSYINCGGKEGDEGRAGNGGNAGNLSGSDGNSVSSYYVSSQEGTGAAQAYAGGHGAAIWTEGRSPGWFGGYIQAIDEYHSSVTKDKTYTRNPRGGSGGGGGYYGGGGGGGGYGAGSGESKRNGNPGGDGSFGRGGNGGNSAGSTNYYRKGYTDGGAGGGGSSHVADAYKHSYDFAANYGTGYVKYDLISITMKIDRSSEESATITTGVKGYFYYKDNNERGNITMSMSNLTFTEKPIAYASQLGVEQEYLHVAAVDCAGNIGETTTIALPDVYHVYYDYNGGTVEKENKSIYTDDTKPFKLIEPTQDGYYFVGWTGTCGEEPQKDVTADTTLKEDLYYTANWIKKEVLTTALQLTGQDVYVENENDRVYYVKENELGDPSDYTKLSIESYTINSKGQKTGTQYFAVTDNYFKIKDSSGKEVYEHVNKYSVDSDFTKGGYTVFNDSNCVYMDTIDNARYENYTMKSNAKLSVVEDNQYLDIYPQGIVDINGVKGSSDAWDESKKISVISDGKAPVIAATKANNFGKIQVRLTDRQSEDNKGSGVNDGETKFYLLPSDQEFNIDTIEYEGIDLLSSGMSNYITQKQDGEAVVYTLNFDITKQAVASLFSGDMDLITISTDNVNNTSYARTKIEFGMDIEPTVANVTKNTTSSKSATFENSESGKLTVLLYGQITGLDIMFPSEIYKYNSDLKDLHIDVSSGDTVKYVDFDIPDGMYDTNGYIPISVTATNDETGETVTREVKIQVMGQMPKDLSTRIRNNN